MRAARPSLGRVLVLASLLVAGPFLAGCTTSADYETLALDAWKARLDATRNAFILDVRSLEEFEAGHVPNATLVQYTEIADRADELPEDKDTPVFVYCRTGRRSAAAAETLVDLGYTNVVNLRGGFPDWERAGHPTAP